MTEQPAPMTVTVALPAKNEAGGIAALVRRIKPLCDQVLVVDGHSTDETAALAAEAGAAVIPDNGRGKGDAYRVAIENAEGDIVVFMDADGSHDAADIPNIVRPIKDGEADMVLASRMRGGSDELYGNLNDLIRMVGGSIITLIINWRFDQHLTDAINGFRAGRKDMLLDLDLRCNDFDIEQEMVMKALKKKRRVAEIPSHEYARGWGASKLPTFRKAHIFIWQLLKNLF